MDSDHLSMRHSGKNHMKTAILQGSHECHGTGTVSEFQSLAFAKDEKMAEIHA
jgi:hypothetical protein